LCISIHLYVNNPINYSVLASNECINSLKGSARIIDEVITGDCTKINKVRTREFTREIIAGEPQLICRMKNDKQA
jgi:hypothetical protein